VILFQVISVLMLKVTAMYYLHLVFLRKPKSIQCQYTRNLEVFPVVFITLNCGVL